MNDVQMLLDAGVDVNAQKGYYDNALRAASERAHEKVVQMLVDAGADTTIQSLLNVYMGWLNSLILSPERIFL